jgi:pantetheine-phosphate adenylyltransferase
MARKGTKRIAVYPGSFDPPTNGHLSLIERAALLFDEVIVAVAVTPNKQLLFNSDERLALMKTSVSTLADARRIRVVPFDGLLAKYAKDAKATAIIRGLRAVSDFEYEFQMALMNRKLAREVETVFLMPALSWVYLSSSIVKDVARNHGDVTDLVPRPVRKAIEKKFQKRK